MPSSEIPADIFTRLSVFDSPKGSGSSNTFKTRKHISLYFERRHLIIYKYLLSANNIGKTWKLNLHVKWLSSGGNIFNIPSRTILKI